MATGTRKRRTREHVIAEMSANHVERIVLQRAHSVERVTTDYGYDLVLSTYDAKGHIENGQVYLQLKASDAVRWTASGRELTFTLDVRDLRLWINEPMPAVLVVYDVPHDRAYWLYIQAHFRDTLRIRAGQRSVTVRIPSTQRVNAAAVDRFRRFKVDVLAQVGGEIVHHA